MPFTLEDINAVTDEQITPELETALYGKFATRFTNHLTNNGTIVKPKADYETEFNTALTQKQKEWADSEAPKFYGAMDKMLSAVGLPKPDGMQTRVWVEQLSKENKIPFTADQMKKLETALKGDGGGSATDKALYDALKLDFDKLKESSANAGKEAFNKLATKATKESLKQAPVTIDSSITDESKKTEAKKDAIKDLQDFFDLKYEAAEDEDGTFYYQKKGTTEPIMDTATGEPMTALEIIRKNHSNMLAKENHQQQGGGSNPSKSKNSPSTEQQIHEAAAEKGLRKFSPEWKQYVEDEKKKLK